MSVLRRWIIAAGSRAAEGGRWRTAVVLRPLLSLCGSRQWTRIYAFENEVCARVHAGDVVGAQKLIEKRLADPSASDMDRNAAINALISAGAYRAALRVQFPLATARTPMDGVGLILSQINLADAEYNLGRWDAAETRLRGLDLACGPFDVTRAGLLQQRAWIAAHRGDGQLSMDLCGRD